MLETVNKRLSQHAVAQLAKLPSFDLGRVMARVGRENPDWSQKRLKAAEFSYREYLAKCKDANEKISPLRDADAVWHAHILHTKQYAEDCDAYFGRFLHHNPLDHSIDRFGQEAANCGTCCQGNCGECQGSLQR